jgi:hypothetical protein
LSLALQSSREHDLKSAPRTDVREGPGTRH